jgi:hypothetical protein
MTTPPAPTATRLSAPPGESSLDPDDVRVYVAPLARAVLVHAVALGVAADLLLRDAGAGLGFTLWIALLALSALSLVWRGGRRLPREARAWLLSALLFAAAVTWREAGRLQFLDLLATLFSLGMAAVALGDARAALFAERVRDTVWAGAAALRSIAAGVVPLVRRELALGESRDRLRGQIGPAMRAILIALPLLLVFGALLRGADPVFASLVDLPALDAGTIVSHVMVIGFFGWVVAGWARAALLADLAAHRAPERLPFSLGLLDITAALGTLTALFALFAATQLGWFFGGERFLQARTGLTAAEYARQGFFQMVWVVMLVVPVLLGTRAALRPGRALERRHTALALPLLALLGVMILSAVLRMRLYVHYFGLTEDRLYPLVFMGWLAVVLVWLALTVLRGAGRTFAAGAVITGLATLLALNVSVPDVIVARVNLARAQRGVSGAAQPLDVEHLSRLGAEAVPFAIAAALAPPAGAPGSTQRAAADLARCNALTRLQARWSRPDAAEIRLGGASWRGWNYGRADAMRAVAARAPALRAAAHESCVPGRRARSRRAPPTTG